MERKKVKDLKLGDSLWYGAFFSGVASLQYITVTELKQTANNYCRINDKLGGYLDKDTIIEDNVEGKTKYYIHQNDVIPKVIEMLKEEISITEIGLDTVEKKLSERRAYLHDLQLQLS